MLMSLQGWGKNFDRRRQLLEDLSHEDANHGQDMFIYDETWKLSALPIFLQDRVLLAQKCK